MNQFDKELWEGIRTNTGLLTVVKKALLNLMVIGAGFRKEAEVSWVQQPSNELPEDFFEGKPGVDPTNAGVYSEFAGVNRRVPYAGADKLQREFIKEDSQIPVNYSTVSKQNSSQLAMDRYLKKVAATYEQNTGKYSAAPGVFSNQNVGNDRGRIQPVEFSDPAFQRASKNMERGGTNAGANAYQGTTNLAQLIKTRNSVQKGTQEYADAQNAINQAYGSKVRHTPGASTGKGDQAVASMKGFGDATEKQTAFTKANPGKATFDYQVATKDVSRKQPSIVDSYMAGLDKATAGKPEVKKSSAFDVYDRYMRKLAEETDAFKELDETPVKKTDTEKILDTWSKDTPAPAVTPGKSKNPAMNLYNAKKEQKKQTGGK